MAVNLPTPGGDDGTWGDELNAAIAGIDADLQAHKAAVPTVGPTGPTGPAGPRGPEGTGGGGDAGTAVSRLVPLIIFNGESNSGGQAHNSSATAAELDPSPAVQIFDNTGLSSFLDLNIPENNMVDHYNMAPGNHGWELQLANSVENGEWWDDVVYLVKTGQGGSAISQWGVGSTFYTKFLQRVRGAIAALTAQGKVPVIYLWFSFGINDAIGGTNEGTWLADTKALHKRMRDDVLGYAPIFWPRNMTSSPGANYNDSIDAYAASDPMMMTIDSAGATQNDSNHWDYAGMKVLSDRLGAASRNFGQHEAYLLRQVQMLSGGTVLAPPVTLPSLVRTPATVTFIEGSAGAAFTVALSVAPAANVTVAVTASGGNVTPSPASLTFSPANFSSAQSVTVTSPNDGTQSGSRSSTVTLSSAGVSSSATVGVTVTDAFVAAGPINSVLPAITGSTALAGVLTCSTGTWSGSPTGYAYQWKRDGTAISGQTATTHTIIAADQAHTLTCTVTATNGSGSNPATSAGTAVPAAPTAPINSVLPSISGAAVVDSTLTCSTGTWSQSPTSYTYQWKANGTNIAGATAASYTVVTDDKSKTLTCVVTATNAVGSGSATSVGVLVTVPMDLTPYSWKDLTNATEDANHWIVSSGGSQSGGNAIVPVDTSQPFRVITDWQDAATAATVVTMLSDTPQTDFSWGYTQTWSGAVFTVNGGSYSGENGGNANQSLGWAPTFPCKMMIERSGNDAVYSSSTDGGTTWVQRYTHTGRFTGKTTQYVRVIFAVPNPGNKVRVSYDAALVSPVPINVTAPAITGSTSVGSVLTCSTGAWTNNPTSYTYQWMRDALPIAGETTNQHTVVAADVETTLLCVVTATNAVGSRPASSSTLTISVNLHPVEPVVFDTVLNTANNAGRLERSAGGLPAGALLTTGMNTSQPFVVQMHIGTLSDANAIIMCLESTNTADFQQDQPFLGGLFQYNGAVHFIQQGVGANPVGSVVDGNWLSIANVGNDLVAYKSTDGVAWTQLGVIAGAISGVSKVWLKLILAVDQSGQKVAVQAGAAS